MSRPPRRRRTGWRTWLLTAGWLVLLWNLLWGDFSWGNLIAGVLVAAVVLRFLPLPPVAFHGRIRPWALLRFLGRFVADLIIASVQLTWMILGPRPLLLNAIIAVRLRVVSDLNLTLVAEAVSLVPGSLIVEADRATGTLYVHWLGVANKAEVLRIRQRVLDLEARIIRAIGSPEELQLIENGGSS